MPVTPVDSPLVDEHGTVGGKRCILGGQSQRRVVGFALDRPRAHKRVILRGASIGQTPGGEQRGMISLLAKFFRGLHLFVGITPPPPGHNERTFVAVWFGMIALVIAFGVFLFFLIGKTYRF